jgi:hypothetical protein
MEARTQFLMRMQMMINEIKASGFGDEHIQKMLDFQLKCREKELIKEVKRKVVGAIEMKNNRGVTATYIVQKTNDKFLDIIDDM